MPAEFRVIGTGRHEPDGDFADVVREALEEHADGELDAEAWETLAGRLDFVTSSADDGSDLARAVGSAREKTGGRHRDSAVPLGAALGHAPDGGDGWRLRAVRPRARIVMEKPFGSDLDSAKALNAALHEHFEEKAIFRIDHFLGKESAQDILALRFANGFFEPVWNRRHIASVQIDVPEDLGLEGRGGFYEETGAFRAWS